MNEVVFSSKAQDWETPPRFFATLDAEFGFTLDACAESHNAKCKRFWSPEDDALTLPWEGVVWCNPPYGYSIGKWIAKGYWSVWNCSADVVVMLIPAKTETSWWHDYVMRAAEIRLVKGRLRFSGCGVNAPFPSAVVVFRPGTWTPVFSAIDRLLDVA